MYSCGSKRIRSIPKHFESIKKRTKNQSEWIRFTPLQSVASIQMNSSTGWYRSHFKIEFIWIIPTSDRFELKIQFASIRARIESDWILYLNHSDLGLIRINSNLYGLNTWFVLIRIQANQSYFETFQTNPKVKIWINPSSDSCKSNLEFE